MNAMATGKGAGFDNTDPRAELYYEKLAQTWWDCRGPFWPLHLLNELRIDYLRHVLADLFGRDAEAPQPLHNLRLLDVGCGGGILSESMARLGAQVHGIDVVEKSIEVARKHACDSALAIRYETASASMLVSRRKQQGAR